MKSVNAAFIFLWALGGVIFVFAAMTNYGKSAPSIMAVDDAGTAKALSAILPAGEIGLITAADHKGDDIPPIAYDIKDDADDGGFENETGEDGVPAAPRPAPKSSSKKSVPGKKSPPKPAPADLPCVDINTAGESALVTLKGIGPATAGKIIGYRAEHGDFARKEDLMKVKGIGPAKLAAVVDRLCDYPSPDY